MASERTSHPGVTGSAVQANSLAPEALTTEVRLSPSAGGRLAD
ncbi:hypothetical protein [Streptomyces sp. NPDC007984]